MIHPGYLGKVGLRERVLKDHPALRATCSLQQVRRDEEKEARSSDCEIHMKQTLRIVSVFYHL